MDYKKYQKSIDVSWQILVDHNITELPVKISSICRELGIRMMSYTESESIFEKFHREILSNGNDGFTGKTLSSTMINALLVDNVLQ